MMEGKMQPKAYLLRNIVYVLLLTTVCMIPFALAQRNSSKSSQDPVGVLRTNNNADPRTVPVPRAHRVR